jgi:hypothetical protein
MKILLIITLMLAIPFVLCAQEEETKQVEKKQEQAQEKVEQADKMTEEEKEEQAEDDQGRRKSK